jgi:hypothetical protein
MWKTIRLNKNIFQIANQNESAVMSSTVFYSKELSFKDFCKFRFESVDFDVWKENNERSFNFESNYTIITKVYSYNSKIKDKLYIVNCIKFKEFYYLSLTFVVDDHIINKEVENLKKILLSLKFNDK